MFLLTARIMINKLFCFFAASIFISAHTNADVAVDGFPNEVKLSSNGNVDVRLFLTVEQTIDCARDGFHFSSAYEGVGQACVSMFQEARVVGRALFVEYNKSDCQVLTVSLPVSYVDGGTTTTGLLRERGALGNVSLIGTNDLSATSYSASRHYLNYSPDAAFDGFTFSDNVSEDATYKASRGLWMTKRRDFYSELTPVWLQVDFGRAVRQTSLRSIVNAQSVNLGRSPQDAVLYIQ